jgi:hypothetical protein
MEPALVTLLGLVSLVTGIGVGFYIRSVRPTKKEVADRNRFAEFQIAYGDELPHEKKQSTVPVSRQKVAEPKSLLILCTRCLDEWTEEQYSHKVYTGVSSGDPFLTQSPSRIACRNCSQVMTFDAKRIPSGGYTKESEACSPDKSCIAFFYEDEPLIGMAFHRLVVRLSKERKAASVSPPASPFPEQDLQAKKLADLEVWATAQRAALAGSPRGLRDLERIIENKRIRIMSGEE